MPDKETLRRARLAKQVGKSPSTQAGEFVQEEIEHVKARWHGVKNLRQAIAIGLSKVRRAGAALRPPKPRLVSEKLRRKTERDYQRGQQEGRCATNEFCM